MQRPNLSSIACAISTLLGVASANAAEQPAAADAPDTVVLARFVDGQVTEQHLESWRRYQRQSPAAEGSRPETSRPDLATIQTLAIQLHLERAAQSRGLHQETELRMGIWWEEVSQLEVELRRWLARRIKLPDSALEQAFEKHKSDFDKPQRVRLRNLFKRWPGADEESRQRLRVTLAALRRQVLAGADFGRLAKRESESQSRWQNGLIGWIKPGQLSPSIERAAMQLGPGQVSEVLETDEGLTLLYCEEAAAAYKADPQEVRAKLRRRLRRAELVEQLKQIRQEALAQARIRPQQLGDKETEAATIRFADGKTLDAEQSQVLLRLGGLGAEATEKTRRSALDEIVYRRAAAQIARREGLDEDPDLRARLEWSRRATLVAREAKDRVAERFETPTTAQLEAYFEQHRQQYRQPLAYQLGLTRKLASRQELGQRYAEMETLASRLAVKELSFEEAARLHSDLPSAKRGGQTEWLPARQLSALGPTVSRAFRTLEEGETSGLIQQSEGLRGDSSLWIIRWLGTRPERELTFEQARPKVLNDYGNEQVRALQDSLYQEVLQQLDLRLGDSSGTP